MPLTKRVLVVDDDATIRELLGSVLKNRDLVIDLAADGREALDLLKQHSYSVVLLDLLMPNVDGFGVLAGLDTSLSLPVVLVITGAELSAVGFAGAFLYRREKDIDIERLGDDAADVERFGPGDLALGKKRGDHQNVAQHPRMIRFQKFQHFESIMLRHAQIEDDRRILIDSQALDRLHPVSGSV